MGNTWTLNSIQNWMEGLGSSNGLKYNNHLLKKKGRMQRHSFDLLNRNWVKVQKKNKIIKIETNSKAIKKRNDTFVKMYQIEERLDEDSESETSIEANSL